MRLGLNLTQSNVLSDQLWMLHTPLLLLSFCQPLSRSHTHPGRHVKMGIPLDTLHSCVWETEHPLFMPHTHTISLHGSVPHAHLHTYTLVHTHNTQKPTGI